MAEHSAPAGDGPGHDDGRHGAAPLPRRGNLAPIALGVGIPGLLLGMIPFYGAILALPLSVVAVVLGLTARGRPEEHRGQATAGLVTGAIGLLLVVGWIGWFAWNQSGLGSFSSESAVQVESGSSAVTVPAEPAAPHDGATDDGQVADDTVTVAPDPDRGAASTGLSGEAEVAIDGDSVTMELADCALSTVGSQGLLARGEGPDGRFVVTQVGDFSAGVVVVLEPADGRPVTYAGTQRGMSGSSGSGGILRDRHRFTLDGALRDVHTDEDVAVELVVTCS